MATLLNLSDSKAPRLGHGEVNSFCRPRFCPRVGSVAAVRSEIGVQLQLRTCRMMHRCPNASGQQLQASIPQTGLHARLCVSHGPFRGSTRLAAVSCRPLYRPEQSLQGRVHAQPCSGVQRQQRMILCCSRQLQQQQPRRRVLCSATTDGEGPHSCSGAGSGAKRKHVLVLGGTGRVGSSTAASLVQVQRTLHRFHARQYVVSCPHAAASCRKQAPEGRVGGRDGLRGLSSRDRACAFLQAEEISI